MPLIKQLLIEFFNSFFITCRLTPLRAILPLLAA